MFLLCLLLYTREPYNLPWLWHCQSFQHRIWSLSVTCLIRRSDGPEVTTSILEAMVSAPERERVRVVPCLLEGSTSGRSWTDQDDAKPFTSGFNTTWHWFTKDALQQRESLIQLLQSCTLLCSIFASFLVDIPPQLRSFSSLAGAQTSFLVHHFAYMALRVLPCTNLYSYYGHGYDSSNAHPIRTNNHAWPLKETWPWRHHHDIM